VAEESLLWFDYETFGLDPARDRPAQFACLRTDLNLNPTGDELTIFCQPPRDYIPNPESCLITGITPSYALREGIPERDFIGRILEKFSVPGTCGVGYNSIRFDDEVTRNTLYRNLHDPFAREWRNGNSRWDLLGVMRFARALRPEGLVWPNDGDGRPTLRLDHLTVANNIPHENAHDAMADVKATLALARLFKASQPRLFDYLWGLRAKRSVLSLVNPGSMMPFVMAAPRFSAESNHLAIVVVLGRLSSNPNALIVYDLRESPEPWITEGRKADDGVQSPFGLLHVNRAPPVASLSSLRIEDQQRLNLDLALHQENLIRLTGLPFRKAADYRALHDRMPLDTQQDPDLGIYSGFASDEDRYRLDRFRDPTSSAFLETPEVFDSPRYRELCFRYKARNFPERLSDEEQNTWDSFCRDKWLQKAHGGSLSIAEFEESIAALQMREDLDARKKALLNETEEYVRSLVETLDLRVQVKG
jgi:exodeoxyribonuclease I